MVYLIMCRSLTYAQRVSNALSGQGSPPGSFGLPARFPPPDAAIR